MSATGIASTDLPAKTAFADDDSYIVNVDGATGQQTHTQHVHILHADGFGMDLTHYDGVDLTEKFAAEIAGYSDVWEWYQARLDAGDLIGINPKDYIPFTCENGATVVAQVADHNHDLGYMDSEVTEIHTDFISRDCWPVTTQWNPVNYNNGLGATAPQNVPYLCSNLYAFCNSLKMNVPNGTGVNPATVEVDYTAGGILYYLPASLKSRIVEKRELLPIRYNASSLLTDDSSWTWGSMGKLWVPSEMEVYGCCAWGTKGYSQATFHQYPIFRDGKMRIKGLGHGGSRCTWWLCLAVSGNSLGACSVDYSGNAYGSSCVNSFGVPVCFRLKAAA